MPQALRLPRTIRMDGTDPMVFEQAAEPGEWAVPGAFVFADAEPGSLSGKRAQAFANGFLGLESFGWSTFVSVATATPAEVKAATGRLAEHFVAAYAAPSLDAALAAARDEVAFAASLCDHPVGTVLSVQRQLTDDGVRESFRALPAAGERIAASIWDRPPPVGA